MGNIPVNYIDHKTRHIDPRAAPDDTLMPTNIKGVYRVATIGDGSCFFHSFLKAAAPKYIEVKDTRERMKMALSLRIHLANKLTEINPKDGKTYWESIGGDSYKDFISEEDNSIDYSMKGLKDLLLSNRYTGDEVYLLIAKVYNYSIYVVRINDKGEIDMYHTVNEKKGLNVIVILSLYRDGKNYGHYELLVQHSNDDTITAIFPEDSGFVRYLDGLVEKGVESRKITE